MHTDDKAFTQLLEAKLALVRSQEILPEELIALVARVTPLLRQAQAQAAPVLPAPEDCASPEAMFAGAPMLLRQHFPFDLKQALSLMPALLDQLAASGGEAENGAKTLRAAIDTGELDPESALRAFLDGDDTLFAAWRARLPGSPRALDFLVTSSLWPSLSAAAAQLAPRLPENLPHEHGHCPLCGSLPYISLLRGKEGKRSGACSFCGHEFRLRRIACAYCDEGEQSKLKQFRVAEYPGVCVDVCETCNMYIKTLDFREMDQSCLPALDDMACVALDVLAQQQGYKRPTLSAWGF